MILTQKERDKILLDNTQSLTNLIKQFAKLCETLDTLVFILQEPKGEA